METHTTRWIRLIFALLLAGVVSIAMARDHGPRIDAGADQVVDAGALVQLKGSIFKKDDDEHHHTARQQQRDDRHEHKRGEEQDDHRGHDREHEHGLQLRWLQTAGTPVALTDGNTLNPHFTAPTSATGSDEVLSFNLQLLSEHGRVLGEDSVSITVLAPRSTITGRVTDVDGTPLSGVNIDVLANGNSISTSTSDTSGHFSLALLADSTVVLQLQAPGYAHQVVPARSPTANGKLFLNISMIARGAPQTFNADVLSTLTGNDGASVSLQPGSFVDAGGNAVTGNIDLSITQLDVSRPAYLAAFPGDFSGTPTAGGNTPIISMGSTEFAFSQNGQALQLAPGASASVTLPIYIASYQDGSPIQIGDTIPLWSLNEDTGIWQQEGSGLVVASTASPTGLAMQATVSHFTWWNCDVSANAAQAIVTVYGPDSGTALIKATTAADIGWRPNTVDTVASVGTPTAPLHVPSNGEVCYWAEISFDNGSTGTTPQVCNTAPPNGLIYVELMAPIAGPVNITTRPADTAGVLNAPADYLNYAAQRVQIQPTTYETAVSYAIVSGSLPPGMNLNAVTATSAEIAGIPTVAGSYSVVVQATDSDGNTDTVTINFSVLDTVPPPILPMVTSVNYNSPPQNIDLNGYNTGGPVTTWSISASPSSEYGPPPPGISLDPATGILTISEYCVFWSGDLTASNSSGSVTQTIDIQDYSCY